MYFESLAVKMLQMVKDDNSEDATEIEKWNASIPKLIEKCGIRHRSYHLVADNISSDVPAPRFLCAPQRDRWLETPASPKRMSKASNFRILCGDLTIWCRAVRRFQSRREKAAKARSQPVAMSMSSSSSGNRRAQAAAASSSFERQGAGSRSSAEAQELAAAIASATDQERQEVCGCRKRTFSVIVDSI